MRTGPRGRALIHHFEGHTPYAYNDPIGFCTAGPGILLHRSRCTAADFAKYGTRERPGISELQYKRMFDQALMPREQAVEELVKVRLNQNEFDALMSFVFNVGVGNFKESTLLRLLNDGKRRAAADQFGRWVFAGGEKLPGLVRRREAERALFLLKKESDVDKRVLEAQKLLRKIGWPITADGELGPKTREAIKDFKAGFNLWGHKGDNIKPFHTVDGKLGPVTLERIRWSANHGGRCSRYFAYHEFRSKGNGWIRVNRELLKGLEEYRKAAGPTGIVSGYRDPAHNAAVGGASSSQHKYATGADLNPKLKADRVRAMRRFSGIGVQRASGLVRHVDVRHAGPNNTTGGTPTNPTVWFYG